MDKQKRVWNFEIKYPKIRKKEILIGLGITGLLLIAYFLITNLINSDGLLYSTNPIIKSIFRELSSLGGKIFVTIILAVIFFGVDKKYGQSVILVYLISNLFNAVIKGAVKDPKTNLSGVKDTSEGYGFPNSNTQNSVSIWGHNFYHLKKEKNKGVVKNIFLCISFALIFLVGIGQLVIGASDLGDVVGAFIIGFIVLNLYFFTVGKVEKIKIKMKYKILISIIGLLLIWLVGTLILGLGEAVEIGRPIGFLLAFIISVPIENTFVKYAPEKLKMIKRVLATILGVTLAFGVYSASEILFKILPAGGVLDNINQFLIYFIFGMAFLLGIPFLLKKLFQRK